MLANKKTCPLNKSSQKQSTEKLYLKFRINTKWNEVKIKSQEKTEGKNLRDLGSTSHREEQIRGGTQRAKAEWIKEEVLTYFIINTTTKL